MKIARDILAALSGLLVAECALNIAKALTHLTPPLFNAMYDGYESSMHCFH